MENTLNELLQMAIREPNENFRNVEEVDLQEIRDSSCEEFSEKEDDGTYHGADRVVIPGIWRLMGERVGGLVRYSGRESGVLDIFSKYSLKIPQIYSNILEYTRIFPCRAGVEVYRARRASGWSGRAQRQPWMQKKNCHWKKCSRFFNYCMLLLMRVEGTHTML
jgi:hypothetical protein